MIKNKVATLAKNLKNNKDVRQQSIQLITELAGVATSVSNGNHSFKLQRIINRTTLGFSTAIALRTLIEIIREHSKEQMVFEETDKYDVRVFNNDQLFNEIRNHIKKNYTSKVAVDGTKESHIIMRSMNITEVWSDEKDADCESVEDLPKDLQILLDGTDGNKGVHVYVEPLTITESVLDIGGFKIEAQYVERKPAPKPEKNTNALTDFSFEPRSSRARGESLEKLLEERDSYLFKCNTLAERKAVQKFLLELGPSAHNVGREQKEYRGSADIYVADASGGGSWSSIPARTADTVILPDGLLDEMVKEIRTFLTYEKVYYMLGVPYHHGIMLSGAPGTGKSSAAQAIASELRMQTYSVSLSTIESNDAFIKFIRGVNENSVVLIEDIDIASAVGERTDAKGGVSMETLLNVLDGVLSPHGCVFILTTNYLEDLDPAVVRPGRIDATYDVTYLIDEQFEKLCRKFMQIKDHVELDLPSIEGLKITPAAIVGVIKKYIPELQDALPHVIKFVEDKRTVLELEASLA